MWTGNLGIGGLSALPYLCWATFALAVGVPLAIWLIRVLNQTWFDPDWRQQKAINTDSTKDTK